MTNGESEAELRRRCEALGSEVGLPAGRGFEVPWERAEAALGTRLPLSYKVFIEYFGPGGFAEELQYFTPGIENSAYELDYCVRRDHSRSLAPTPHGDLSYSIFPEPDGLLLFATLPEDAVYWDTSIGGPDDWPIVIPSLNRWMLRYEGDIISFVGDLLIEAPAIGDVEYDPALMREFTPNDGGYSGGRHPALMPYSFFRNS